MPSTNSGVNTPWKVVNAVGTRSKPACDRIEYPYTPKCFRSLVQTGTLTPISVKGISASAWTGENLLSLGLLVRQEKIWFWASSNIKKICQITASNRVQGSPQLANLITAVEKADLKRPLEEILDVLVAKNCQIGYSFYSSLQEQLSKRLFANNAEPIVSTMRELRPRSSVNYYPNETASEASISVVTLSAVHSKYDPATDTTSADFEKPPIKDELVTTSAGIDFIKLVMVLLQADGMKRSHGTEYHKPGISQNYYKEVKTRAGSYGCKTDGSVHVMRWWGKDEQYRDDVVLLEIEAKADSDVVFLPQHAAELLAQMWRRKTALEAADIKSWDSVIDEYRRPFLVCLNGTSLRIISALFSVAWLNEFLGPIGEDVKESPLLPENLQEIFVSTPLCLEMPYERLQAAEVIAHLAVISSLPTPGPECLKST
ncbi:hypothetical protein D9615_002111 [Tricholomella constricta]|uniref:Uncharacterized protein n=1 Tax=Tricholomella constricta TaxID=117010 RepID=A0A8H5HPZ4_9AGAR|nr:hypothetical protein D9615_002111 [Tricholomella constricta]